MTDTQPQQPQTALDLWTEQVQSLAAPEQADAAINVIHERLMKMHANFTKNDMVKQAGQVEEAYNMAVAIYNYSVQQGAVIAGGSAAIQAVDDQRKQAVTELQQLLKAIDDGDESHPKLQWYAENIRQDEADNAMYDIDDDYYAEIFDDNVRSNIDESWEVEGMQGSLIYQALLGEFTLKKDHAKRLQALIRELPVEFADYMAYKRAASEEPDDDADGDE